MTLRPFQIILFGIFIALAVGGLIAFAVFRGFGSDPNPYGDRVEIWGTFDSAVFSSVLESIADEDDNFDVVTYRRQNHATFSRDLANAIAEGRGPDAIILPSDLVVSERAKIYPIPYETLPVRTVRDTYVDGAEIFLLTDGVYGFPFAVDPLVMYWNRDLFASAGIATPPANWEQLLVAVPRLVQRGDSFSILRAALAFGEYANVAHASDILLTLLLQAGSSLITEDGARYVVSLNQASGQVARPPLDASLDFYTQFANPSSPLYTWNRSLPQDKALFLSGDLALYFGPGSEYGELQAGNVNLNFDAAPVPQGADATVKKSYGTFYSFAILRSTDNLQGTYQALTQLSQAERARVIAEGLSMAPVHRTTLAAGSTDPYRQTMYTMALFSRGFLSPDPVSTGAIFRMMVEDVTSGRSGVNEAAKDVEGRLNQLLR